MSEEKTNSNRIWIGQTQHSESKPMSKQHAPAFLTIVDQARRKIREIQAADLPAHLDQDGNAVVIDVREESEFAAGHVAGARHIGKGVIERDVEGLYPDKDQTLYLYCGGGFRSALAADALRQMGYRNAVSVDGGWRELQSIMPTQS